MGFWVEPSSFSARLVLEEKERLAPSPKWDEQVQQLVKKCRNPSFAVGACKRKTQFLERWAIEASELSSKGSFVEKISQAKDRSIELG
jgi:hypothetical protein